MSDQYSTAVNEPKHNVISVQNPSESEMKIIMAQVKLNYDFSVDVKPSRFNFKKSTDKESGIETVRGPVELAIPYPSAEGIVAILEAGGKSFELLMSAMEDVINGIARDILYEDITLTAATFPVDKLAWDIIANMPKAARRGGGIPKETWEDFAADYCEVMPGVTGKSIEQVGRAAKLLLGKLAQVKTNMPVLEMLTDQLAIYAESSPQIEDFQDCVAFLLDKSETYQNVSPAELLANL